MHTCVHVCWGGGRGGEGEERKCERGMGMIILLLTSQCHKHNSPNDPAPLQALLGGCP